MITSPHMTPALLAEYENRVIDAYDYLDEDEIERLITKGEAIDLHFGSTSYEVLLQQPTAGQSSSIFLKGYCVLFAHVYAKTYGTSKALLITSHESGEGASNWSGHIVTSWVDADGNLSWVDFRGIVKESDLLTEYPLEKYSHEVLELSEALDRTVTAPYRGDPLSFLDPLEAAFVHMVVDEVEEIIKR